MVILCFSSVSPSINGKENKTVDIVCNNDDL